MCNEYAREIEMGRVIRYMEEMKDTPPFAYVEGRIPNNIGPTKSIRIRDKGMVVRLKDNKLEGASLTWAWQTPRGKPVFNFVSEGRDFSKSDRVAVIATGFYEYTTPKQSGSKLKDQHLFTLKGEEWFWIAGVVQQDCFSLLTTRPGPDIAQYHDRQICVLHPEQGLDWLSRGPKDLLAPQPKGALAVRTLRENGKALN
jgi:putative SOS response-associated peptidase YedK